MKKFHKITKKESLLKAVLTVLVEQCSFPVYFEEEDKGTDRYTCQVSKFDLQFLHCLESASCLSACIYDHYPLEYRDVERRDGSNTKEAYYTVGLSVL